MALTLILAIELHPHFEPPITLFSSFHSQKTQNNLQKLFFSFYSPTLSPISPLSFKYIFTKAKVAGINFQSPANIPFLREMSTTSLANPANPPSSTDIYASPSATIILTVVLLLFFFIGFFSIYFCRCFMSNLLLTWHIGQNPSNTQENASDGPKPYPGLDSSIIETFPTFKYLSVKEYRKAKVGLECAICLCEFEDDNDLRLLPICCHVFHQECIDLWLESHKSCPFCRRALDTPLEKSPNVSAHGGGILRQNSIPEHESLPDTYTVINIKDNENERDHGNGHHKGDVITGLSSSSEGTEESKAEKFARSKSTGHSIVRKGRGGGGEEEEDRFTLRLPEHVQAKLLRGHQGTRSCTTFGEFKSKTSAGNGGFGEVTLSTGDDNKV